MLMFVFLLGSYVVFTSIYRLRVFLLYSSDDISYTLASGCAWNVIEISAGAIAACVPTLVPLVRELVTLFTSVSSSFTGSSIMTVRDSGGNATTPLGRQKQPQVSSISREAARYGITDVETPLEDPSPQAGWRSTQPKFRGGPPR